MLDTPKRRLVLGALGGALAVALLDALNPDGDTLDAVKVRGVVPHDRAHHEPINGADVNDERGEGINIAGLARSEHDAALALEEAAPDDDVERAGRPRG